MGDAEPDLSVGFNESGVLERLRGLEAVFTFPGLTVFGDVEVEDAAADLIDLGTFLPAEVIYAVKLIEGRLGGGAVLHEVLLAAGRPGLAVLAFGEPVIAVAVLLTTDCQPGAIGQAVDRGLGQGRFARAVEVADDRERVGSGVQGAEGLLGSEVVVDRNVSLAVELLEVVEEVQASIDGFAEETLLGGVGVQILRLQVESAFAGLQLHAMDLRLEGHGAKVEVAIVGLRLAFAGLLAGEPATKRLRTNLLNAGHEAGADG